MLGNLLGQVLSTIGNHANQQANTGFDPSALMQEVSGLFQQHAVNTGQPVPQVPAGYGGNDNIRPASQDPYGDPADQVGGRNIRPASEDPYGDPADRAA